VALAAYNDRVLAFLRQPNITDVLKERGRTISLSSQLKSKIIQIRSDGIPALERFANDVDLITLLRYGSSQVCAFNRCYCFFTLSKDEIGENRRGRPRTAWMDNIKTLTGLPVEESVRMTEDRDKWRKYVHGVANSQIARTAKEMSAGDVDS